VRRVPTWPIAAGSLIAGFAVAQGTGVRPLGGVVLVAGAAWCGLRWRSARGLPLATGLVALYLLAFAVSHPLGRAIGSWPSVVLVSALVGAAAWALADAPRRRIGRPA
jgi:hypothetical protein